MLRTDYESYEVTCKCLLNFTLVRNKSLKLCAHEIDVWLQLLGIVCSYWYIQKHREKCLEDYKLISRLQKP